VPSAFLDLARNQHGVVATHQLTDFGIHPSVTRRRIANGTWKREGRAVIIPAWVTDDDEHEAWVLQVAAGMDAIVSGPLAARLSGWFIPGRERIVVRSSYTHRLGSDIHVLRRETPANPAQRGLLSLATRLDALADTLITRPWGDACDLLDSALQSRWIDQAILDSLIARRSGRGRKGVGRLRKLRSHVTGNHRSEAERRVADVLARSGTGEWLANYLLQSRGRVVAELDFAQLATRIAIEVDGRAYHSDSQAFERDRVRQNRLATEGWLVLRFTWKQITEDSAGVMRTVRHAVHLRSRSAS